MIERKRVKSYMSEANPFLLFLLDSKNILIKTAPRIEQSEIQ
jgi:hypothetical protein